MLYGWTVILTTDILATWRHYIGVVLFITLILLFFKSEKATILATGVFLLVATFNGLAMTAAIKTFYFGSSSNATPPIQMLSLGILILYFVLNLDSLIEMQLDYKERKAQRK
jgi:hypothetical protein